MSIKKLFRQSSSYFIGEALIVISTFISFPILSRLLTQNQYGLMSLISVSVAILDKVSSLGTNHTIVRFYNSYKANLQSRKFIFSLIGSMFGAGILIILCGVIIFLFLIHKTDATMNFVGLFSIALVWGFFQNSFNLLNMFNRLEGKILLYNLFGIFRKYISMLVAVYMVFISRDLYLFYIGNLSVEICFVIILFYFVWKKTAGFTKELSFKKVFRETTKYGVPLALSGIATIIFSLGNRYVIAYLLDTRQVAVYSVGANLCNYSKDIIITAINLALLPIIFDYWEKNNISAVRQTLIDLVRYYFLFAMFFVALFSIIPKELVVLIASTKYVDSALIIPILIAGEMICGFMVPFVVPFNIRKKTGMILMLTIFAAVLNILLNFIFIPLWGLYGVAYATLATSLILVSLTYLLSQKYLPFDLPIPEISRYMLASAFGYLICVKIVEPLIGTSIILRFIVKGMTFFIIYSLLVLLLDSKIRNVILRGVNRMSCFMIRT